MWLTMTTVPVLPRRWPVRLGFWIVTMAAWFVVAVMMQARTELDFPRRAAVLFGAGVTVVAAVWFLFKIRASLGWRVLGEFMIATVLLLGIGDLMLVSYQAETRLLRERAEARWAEIGLPMAEFEKTLVATRENAGSEVLRQVLREEVGALFYKAGTRTAELELVIEGAEKKKRAVQDAGIIVSAIGGPSDDLDLSLQPIATIAPLAGALDADYRRILATEPPTWASNPRDGTSIDVPNFLGLRQFAMLAAADAARRFSEGDQEGAARAISAGQRATASLRKNPTLVSLMIHIAVEAMMASKRVRLPASEEGLSGVARDAVELRAEFLKRIQLESWMCLRFTDQIGEYQQGEVSVLPRWLGRIWRRREVVKAALNGAEHAAIQKDSATLMLPDLGIGRHNAISEASPTTMEFNVSRAAMRITATQLLCEQAELIRLARARMAAGRPMEPYQSAVIPAARWELTMDAEKATVSTRLIGAPVWILRNEVTGPQFWVLPLDGSVSWQFHQSKSATGDR
jgi:hypothetical protein